MRKLKVALPAALVAGLLLVWGVQFAISAPGSDARHSTAAGSKTGRIAQNVQPNAVIFAGPARTYFSSGDSEAAISGFTPVGSPISVTCPGTAKCKIEIDNSVQVSGNTTASNEVAVFEYMDGTTYSSPGGPWTGELPTDNLYQVVSSIEFLNAVPHGTHTIQPYVTTSAGAATVNNYSFVVRVYKPS